MAYTDEPAGLAWINNVNPNAFGSLVSQACWFIGSVSFTWLACYLMTRQDVYLPVGVMDEHGVRQLVMMSKETTRSLGNGLAIFLLGAWTGKSVLGAYDSKNKRESSPEYAQVLEAKERGKVAGAAAAVVIAEKAKDVKAMRESGLFQAPVSIEHPAQPAAPQVVQNVNVGDAAPVADTISSDGKSPTEPDNRTDDESGQ